MRFIFLLIAFMLTTLNAKESVDLYKAKQTLFKQAYKEYKNRLELLDKVIKEDEQTLLKLHQSELSKRTTPIDPAEIPHLQKDIEENKKYRVLLLKGFSHKKELIEKAFTPIEEDYFAKVYEEIPLAIGTMDQSKILYPELLETMVVEKKEELGKPLIEENPKRIRVGGIACDDMKQNSVILSSTCKEKVMNVLNFFTKDHYYELIPILDKNPLSSFDHLKGKVPSKTIHYLETMALQGIAQSRITEAKVLIRQVHGEKANIDYPLIYIKRDNRRGFALRIYR